MLNDYLNHTDIEEGWIQGFQNPNGMQKRLSKIDATV